jgi:hypothetical protein
MGFSRGRAMQELCFNGWGKGKVKYRTEAAARKAARKTKSGIGLKIYFHRDCGSFHLTCEEQRNKTEQPPSAAKLRRRLENYAREIQAAKNRLSTAEKTYLEELEYIDRVMARMQRV